MIGTAARLGLAGALGLGVDESYAVASARQVSWSYFDHPPLSFWLAHVSARMLGTESHLAVRLPFVLLFALTTWLMYRVTARAFGEPAGAIAALALNLSAVFSATTGMWVLPDGPLMCALLAAAYCLVRVLLDPSVEGRDTGRWWLGAGVCSGVALLSKYQAALFLAGAALFILTRQRQRHWLRRPEPYLAVAVAFAMFAPVVVWNAQHGWASFAFQLGRGASPAAVTIAKRLGALGLNVAGQAGWLLPWIWLALIAALLGAMRREPRDDAHWLFACLGIVPVALFTAISLGGRPGLPHWAASGYLFLFPLLGAAVSERTAENRSVGGALSDRAVGSDRTPAWLVASGVAFAALLAIAASATITGWPARTFPGLFRRGDPTLEAVDWRDLNGGLDTLAAAATTPHFVAATSWVQAGKIAYALGPGVPVLCLSGDPRHFGFLFDQRAFVGQDAVIVDRWPARHDVPTIYGAYFERIAPLGRITIHRAGRPAFDVAVYLGHRFLRPYPSASAGSPTASALMAAPVPG